MAVDWQRELSLLKSYQEHFLVVLRCGEKLTKLESERTVLLHDVEEVRQALVSTTAKREQAELDRKGEELEIESEKVSIQTREAKLFAIKTNKEYQAGIKEVAEAKKVLKAREDRVLQLMELVEGLGKECTQLSEALADKERVCANDLQAMTEEAAALARERDEAAAAATVVEGQLRKETLESYRYVQRRYPDAMAAVRGTTCSGCHMRVPPQRLLEMRKFVDLISCATCYRILYYEAPAEEAETGQ
ncbi:MAG: hypothetical protein HY696_08850 [Deltaproteobacteria bacterium]|nr:hypothetical protein [Deltaproteobacteria bacterium]